MKNSIVVILALVVTSPCLLAAAPPIWEDNYGPRLQLYNDDCAFVSLGFPFAFYGKAYDGVWVNSNGNVTFNGCNTRWTGFVIPDPVYDIVAPLYGDFDPYLSGAVYAHVLGPPGERRLIVTWYQVPRAGLWNGRSHTFQVQLFEGIDTILFAYNGLQSLGFNRDGSPMTVGISAGSSRYTRSATGAEIPALDMSNICYLPNGGGYSQVFGPCMITAAIDVKPRVWPNSINTRGNGKVAVAILGRDGLDVLDIDPESLRFGPAAAVPEHDLSHPGRLAGHLKDVNGDGRLDLVSHYSVKATGLAVGDIHAVLEGWTYAGLPFEGWDSVEVVK